jgi:S-adenosyl methyltransferase
VADAAARPGVKLDTTVSHSARIWNYWLGGKDNFAVDRQAGDKVAAMLPSIVAQARADRAFLGRAVRYLAGEAGIRHFLDIGTGLPTADNTHQVAQSVAPESRIVYADNDRCKSGCAHARNPPGFMNFSEVRQPGRLTSTQKFRFSDRMPIPTLLWSSLNNQAQSLYHDIAIGQLRTKIGNYRRRRLAARAVTQRHMRSPQCQGIFIEPVLARHTLRSSLRRFK